MATIFRERFGAVFPTYLKPNVTATPPPFPSSACGTTVFSVSLVLEIETQLQRLLSTSHVASKLPTSTTLPRLHQFLHSLLFILTICFYLCSRSSCAQKH